MNYETLLGNPGWFSHTLVKERGPVRYRMESVYIWIYENLGMLHPIVVPTAKMAYSESG